jgi:hypothetical protein
MATDKYEPFYSNRLGMVTDKQMILVAYEYFRTAAWPGLVWVKLNYMQPLSGPAYWNANQVMVHLVDTTDHNVTLTD